MTRPASADMSRMMTNYLIVVPRGNRELFELLSVAFSGQNGFNVVIDRRGPDAPASRDDVPDAPAPDGDGERRGGGVLLGPDEIVIAERAERAERADRAERTDRPVTGGEPRAYRRIPVRRRRAGRSTRPGSPSPRPEPLAAPSGGGATAC
jgi:hypothetical protein